MLPEPLGEAVRVLPANNAELATHETVAVEGRPFARALRVRTVQRPKQAWGVQVQCPIVGAFRKGDVCLLSCYVRGGESADEAGDAVAHVHVQHSRSPWTKLATTRVTANRQWRRALFAFKAKAAVPDGGSNLVFHLGFRPQTLEIGGLSLVNYGRTKKLGELPGSRVGYRGREPDAPWRKAAAERIERIRKADLTVEVVDAAGKPVPGAAVEMEMTRHAFGFGSAVTAHMLCVEGEDGRRYRATVAKLYNKIVFENDLKWWGWEIGRDNRHARFRREWVDRAIAWLRERDIEIRGHYIAWAPLKPQETRKYAADREALRRDLWAHMDLKVPALGDRIAEWDAVNHIVGWGETLAAFLRDPEIYVKILRRSRQLAPHAELWVNEGQILPGGRRRDAYEKTIRHLITNKAAPDGIGFMGHFSATSLTPPAEVHAVLDRYAKIIPKLQLTEFDVNTDDEELQADYLRDILTIAFSHPACEAAVMWGFWQGRHWKPDAALYRRDWSPKPAGEAWERLVFSDWWTRAKATTDAQGRCSARGFLGRYAVTVRHGGKAPTKQIELPAAGATARVAVDSPP